MSTNTNSLPRQPHLTPEQISPLARSDGMRIVLIHALRQSIDPTLRVFERLWPDAQLTNLLDDSLSQDLALAGSLKPEMFLRFQLLSRYAASLAPAGILFTCSAFGPCIDAVAHDLAPLPVVKPYQAMIEEAGSVSKHIGVLATFAPTLTQIVDEIRISAPALQVSSLFVKGALEALSCGDSEKHDRLIVEAALSLSSCSAIVLSQFSLARAAGPVAIATGLRVLTAPDTAVRYLRRIVLG